MADQPKKQADVIAFGFLIIAERNGSASVYYEEGNGGEAHHSATWEGAMAWAEEHEGEEPCE